jgi:hypothetical protein
VQRREFRKPDLAAQRRGRILLNPPAVNSEDVFRNSSGEFGRGAPRSFEIQITRVF